jgi:serine/threonine protein kinase/Tfp pilus assembly protein PilF
MIAKTLGHYRVVEKIGAGGMGEVYRAYDEKLERDVALKVLPAGMLADEVARKRFRKEALVLAKLNHPNIETIYEFASQDNVDFLAMELITGVTLSEKLDRGPLPDQQILSLGAQIAEGLNAAHEKGVVHCDLKPGNVMVMPNGHAKVLDFGLAKFFQASKESSVTESLTETQAQGTLPYMSPEQVRGERVDSRTDIYAAGAVLYEMSTGKRPFPDTQAPGLIYAILHQEPSRPSAVNRRVPPGLENVILKALDKIPERRYQSARELAVDLGRLSSPALRVLRPPRKKLQLWLFGAAAAMVVVGLVFAIPSVRRFVVHPAHARAPSPTAPSSIGAIRLAILPFQVEGDPTSLNYIADGVAESLYIRLSQLSSLNVVANDAIANSDMAQPLDKLGRALGANVVLRGQVSRPPQSLKVVVNLQRILDQHPYWTQEFSARTSELPSVQDQIFDRLLTALSLSENEDEGFRAVMRPEISWPAYDLYLKGREEMSPRQSTPAPEQAIHFYEEALKKDPNFDLAYVGMADANLALYQEKKDKKFSQRAVEAAGRAVLINDASPGAHYALAHAYKETSKSNETVEELKKVVSLVPNSDDAYRRLGDVYLAIGDWRNAVEVSRKAVQLNPLYWANQNALGNAYFRQGAYDKALQAFQQVSVLEPDIVVGYENVGSVYLQQGKNQESIAYFQKALQIEPNFATYSNLGTAYFILKQYSNAVEMFEKALTLNRGDSLMMANMADSYRALGNQDKARAAYQRVIYLGDEQLRANSRDADSMEAMALSYAKLGDAQQADNFIRRARAIDKNNVNYVYAEAQIDAVLGKTAEALQALQESFEKHYPAEYTIYDPDLDNIRNYPEFKRLIDAYSKQTAMAPVAAP